MGPDPYSCRIHLRSQKEATLSVCFSEPGTSQTSCSILARDMVTVGGFLGIWARIQLCLLCSLQRSKSVAYSFSPLMIPINPEQRKEYISTKGNSRLPGEMIRRWKELCNCDNLFLIARLCLHCSEKVIGGIAESPADDPQQTHLLLPIPKPLGSQLGTSSTSRPATPN